MIRSISFWERLQRLFDELWSISPAITIILALLPIVVLLSLFSDKKPAGSERAADTQAPSDEMTRKEHLEIDRSGGWKQDKAVMEEYRKNAICMHCCHYEITKINYDEPSTEYCKEKRRCLDPIRTSDTHYCSNYCSISENDDLRAIYHAMYLE